MNSTTPLSSENVDRPQLAITNTEIALLVRAYLRNENFSEALRCFERECGERGLFHDMDISSHSVRNLSELLSEYIVMKQEQMRRDQVLRDFCSTMHPHTRSMSLFVMQSVMEMLQVFSKSLGSELKRQTGLTLASAATGSPDPTIIQTLQTLYMQQLNANVLQQQQQQQQQIQVPNASHTAKFDAPQQGHDTERAPASGSSSSSEKVIHATVNTVQPPMAVWPSMPGIVPAEDLSPISTAQQHQQQGTRRRKKRKRMEANYDTVQQDMTVEYGGKRGDMELPSAPAPSFLPDVATTATATFAAAASALMNDSKSHSVIDDMHQTVSPKAPIQKRTNCQESTFSPIIVESPHFNKIYRKLISDEELQKKIAQYINESLNSEEDVKFDSPISNSRETTPSDSADGNNNDGSGSSNSTVPLQLMDDVMSSVNPEVSHLIDDIFEGSISDDLFEQLMLELDRGSQPKT